MAKTSKQTKEQRRKIAVLLKEDQFIMQDIISRIEEFCTKENINHRFVGGVSFGGLLNKQTTYEVNIAKKEIKLFNHNILKLTRSDRSVKDIDIIYFCNNGQKVKLLKKFIASIIDETDNTVSFKPSITVEGAIYLPWQKRNKILQFVTTIEVQSNDYSQNTDVSLTFDSLSQKISWESLEPWTVILEDRTKYTVRNPIADYYAYQFRAPCGLKPKDKHKMKNLQNLMNEVIKKGQEDAIDYTSAKYFKPWQAFVTKIDKSKSFSIMIKKGITRWYWRTIGTSLAHGKGFLGGFLLHAFSNKFTGVKQ
jgi:hypothetical protein